MTAQVVIVMGVSGAGKTTIGKALAARLGAGFAEGDQYHSAENVAKMRSGTPLTDDDRWPWLDRLRAEIERWLAEDRRMVLACSALKQRYRDRLTGADARVALVYLTADRQVIAARLARRKGHYMPASLLDSQLRTLEEPEDAIIVDTSRPAAGIVADLEARLR